MWKEHFTFIFKWFKVPYDVESLKMKVTCFFQMLGTTYPALQCVTSEKTRILN